MILPGFLIGVAATAATWIVVRLFPKQKYPKDNALVAAIGFGGALLRDGVYCISKLMAGAW